MRGVVLRVEEREVISRELAGGLSCRAIAVVLGRHQSVVSREVDRHGGRGSYRAVAAQECADRDRGRPNERVLVENKRLHEAVRDGLADKWSPRQVSRRLREDFAADDTLRVSHEAIYQTLYLQARGELRTQLSLALRRGRTRRVNRSRAAVARGNIVGMVNISERPVEAEDRAVPGFWEGDLIIGQGGRSQIATLVEGAEHPVRDVGAGAL